jgi:hypothetical protein
VTEAEVEVSGLGQKRDIAGSGAPYRSSDGFKVELKL